MSTWPWRGGGLFAVLCHTDWEPLWGPSTEAFPVEGGCLLWALQSRAQAAPPLGPTPCFVLTFPPSNTSPGEAFPRFFSLYLCVAFAVLSKYLDFRDWKLGVLTDCSQPFAFFLVSRGKECGSALKRAKGKGGEFVKNVTLLLSTPRWYSARPAVNDCSK